MRILSRINDTDLMMAIVPLFSMVALPPGQWNQQRIEHALKEIATALGFLEEYIDDQGYAIGASLSQADGALIPTLLLVAEWQPIFRPPQPLFDAVPKTRKYGSLIGRDSIAAQVPRRRPCVP